MTTIVTVRNDGPDHLVIRYYDQQRQLSEKGEQLAVGESIQITVWDGNLPVMWALGLGEPRAGPARFQTVPPATDHAARS